MKLLASESTMNNTNCNNGKINNRGVIHQYFELVPGEHKELCEVTPLERVNVLATNLNGRLLGQITIREITGGSNIDTLNVEPLRSQIIGVQSGPNGKLVVINTSDTIVSGAPNLGVTVSNG